jgi:hypothetical protein
LRCDTENIEFLVGCLSFVIRDRISKTTWSNF